MQKSLIVLIILAILLVVFAVQNAEETLMQLWFWEVRTSQALIVFIAFAIGSLMGVAFSYPSINKKNRKIKELSKTITAQHEQHEEHEEKSEDKSE